MLKLDQQIVIQTPTESVDGQGSVTETWATLDTVWAEKRDLRGQEGMTRESVEASMNVAFRIRGRTDVTTKMRISHDSLYYDIMVIKDSVNRGLYQDLMCILRAA
ncbi:MAG TPA: phage head closure protein [Phycisphaerae bacterium]|nr:phage head closure protein [Phycisphaerae bacterium]